ncbi:CCA tRNA nucleotidyltransferase [Candidatus Pelagibacter bacterium]|nr:CCA tRNA nucleotidyltransferase [Candidatus Pelagibacter bacterium]MDA9618981.1 CCA tRNA nucleotidyltransferase [Candidatus Pelagibacter bacterium]
MLNFSLNFINKIKRSLFPFYKDKELKFVFNKIQEGFSADTVTARFVGGCVRKYLSNDKIDDIDIATILSAEEIIEKFKKTKFNVIKTGIKHGTVTLVTNKFNLEITTLRKDVETDGRHAEVEYIDNWQLDSERRDFTINAIYLDIYGKIFDPQMGTVDLKNNNVKFIGDPQKRIEEDYLRIIRFLRFKIMYDSKVEISTINAIKQNLDGIKKISKERILIELYKILDLKNFINLNESIYLKEIFSLIFPEFENLKRLERLKKICDYTQVNRELLLAALLIDEKKNQEYFAHKYNVSNNIKENLHISAKNLILIKANKDFFKKDLEKNIYLNDKNHLINLNILNFVINEKLKFKDFSENLKKILQSKKQKLPVDGKYLIDNGMKQGSQMGRVLKKIEEEWIKNNFEISDDQMKEIIRLHSN